MIADLTEEELLDAHALYELNPMGGRRDDMRAFSAAIVASGAASQMPDLFYPYFGDSFETQQEDEAVIADLIARGYLPDDTA